MPYVQDEALKHNTFKHEALRDTAPPALLETKEMRTEQIHAKKMEIYSETHTHTYVHTLSHTHTHRFVQKLYVFTIALRRVFEGDYVFY